MATKIESRDVKGDERRTQEQRSSETRRKLMDATVALIVEFGFASLTTMKVADKAGVSRGAMQHHFSTKNDLLLAVVDEIWVRMHQPNPPQPVAGASLEAHVDLIVDRYWHSFTDTLFPAVTDIWVGSRSDPTLFARINDHLQNVFAESAQHWREYFAALECGHQCESFQDFTGTAGNHNIFGRYTFHTGDKLSKRSLRTAAAIGYAPAAERALELYRHEDPGVREAAAGALAAPCQMKIVVRLQQRPQH